MKRIIIVAWRAIWILPYSLAFGLTTILAWIMYGPESRRQPERYTSREHATQPGSTEAHLRTRPLRVAR